MVMENKNIHSGHRERLRARALETNLEGFEEHQILELLLGFVIPRKDTNPIAHNLIKEFGSLSGVLNAEVNDLTKVSGVSNYSASFLVLLKDVFRKYKQSQVKNIKTITNTREAIQICKSEIGDLAQENILILCIDNSNRVAYKKILATGFSNTTSISIRKIVDVVVKSNSSNIILSHNHPNGTQNPSPEDDDTTQKLVLTLGLSGINILDNIIVGNDGCYSYFVSGKLSKYYENIKDNKILTFNQNKVKYIK